MAKKNIKLIRKQNKLWNLFYEQTVKQSNYGVWIFLKNKINPDMKIPLFVDGFKFKDDKVIFYRDNKPISVCIYDVCM